MTFNYIKILQCAYDTLLQKYIRLHHYLLFKKGLLESEEATHEGLANMHAGVSSHTNCEIVQSLKRSFLFFLPVKFMHICLINL